MVEQASADKRASPGATEQASLTEAQIALFADLANGAEEEGKLAQGEAQAPAVKGFANMMTKHQDEVV